MRKKLIAYTDGSYNSETKQYGCGMVLVDENDQEVLRKHKTGRPDARGNGWNINGEIEAALMAVHAALEQGCQELVIYHDYEGVGKWPDGIWAAKKAYTQDYADEINRLRKKIQIRFVHVKGHNGNRWNEIADEEAGIGANGGIQEPALEHSDEECKKRVARAPQHAEGLKMTCIIGLQRFYRVAKPSFGDFAALRTGGFDAYSRMPIPDMEEKIGEEESMFIRDRINQEKDYAAALRWRMRGLSANDAAHKVNVDREISDNARNRY